MSLQRLHIAALLIFFGSPVTALVVNQHSNSQPSLKASPLSNDFWNHMVHESHILLLHSQKRSLTFCMIPKNACTEFLALMMRLDGMSSDHYNPTMYGKKQERVHKDKAREQMFFHGTTLNRTFGKYWKKAFEDPLQSKVKAFFYRDPVERLVSAYISKVRTGHFDYMRERNPFRTDMSLQEVVEVLENQDLKLVEMHVRPQSYTCGLEETLEQYTFVGSMDHLQVDAHKMLELAGGSTLAHEMLDNGWGQFGTQSLFGVSRNEREGKLGMQTTAAQNFTQNLLQPLGSSHAASDVVFESNRAEQILVQRELELMDSDLRSRIQNLYQMDYALIQRAEALGLTRWSHRGLTA